mgnify:CR=1 FL=1
MAKAKGKKKTEVLDYGAQVRSLREQGPGRLYLLWGREDYLREQYLLELKKLCLLYGVCVLLYLPVNFCCGWVTRAGCCFSFSARFTASAHASRQSSSCSGLFQRAHSGF